MIGTVLNLALIYSFYLLKDDLDDNVSGRQVDGKRAVGWWRRTILLMMVEENNEDELDAGGRGDG